MGIKQKSNLIIVVMLSLMILVTFVFTFFRGITSLTQTWRSFVNICITMSASFVNYYLTHINFGFLLIFLLFCIGVVAGILFFLSQIRKSYLLRRHFENSKISSLFSEKRNNLINVVNDDRLFAFTIGFFKPVIYFSNGLKSKLSKKELDSVIAHEQAHQAYYHPLVLLFINTIQRTLFFFPLLKGVKDHINLKLEIFADKAAISVSSRKLLVSALVKVNEDRGNFKKIIVSVPGFSSANKRINFISRNKRPLLKLSWRLIILSIITLFLSNIFLISPLTKEVHAQELVFENGESITSEILPCHCSKGDKMSIWLPMISSYDAPNMSFNY